MKRPTLTQKEESDLAISWQSRGDILARNELVNRNQGLIRTIARRLYYNCGHVEFDDLVSEGNLGLIRACDTYDPSLSRFSTYASTWIRCYMIRHETESVGKMRILTTEDRRDIFFKASRVAVRLRKEGINPTIKAVADVLGVSEKDIDLVARHKYGSAYVYLDASRSNDDDNTNHTSETSSEQDNPESIAIRENWMRKKLESLNNAIALLPSRERDILTRRLLSDDPPTLSELGAEYQLSRERIRQLEEKSLREVAKSVRRAA
jgi:RNA polymerase sigma-32 factor